MWLNILVIVIGLVLLLVLTLKKVNIAIAALISVAFIILFSGLPMLDTLNNYYLKGFANFAQSAWLMILLGAILSKLMDISGAARAIAQLIIKGLGTKLAIPAVVISGALMTFGGVQAMVACFTLYPIAVAIFRDANLPRYLIPAAIGSGMFTFVYMLPGSPQIVNIIPTKYLGTSATAAPVLGLFAGILSFVLILLYLQFQVRKARKAGQGFIADDNTEKALRQSDELVEKGNLPNSWVALVPLVLVAVALDGFKLDISWSLLVGIVACFVLFWKNLFNKEVKLNSEITEAATQGAILLVVSSAIVGLGSAIQATPGFKGFVGKIVHSGKSWGNPIAIFGIATAVLCGLCASAMGGLSITLAALSKPFLSMGVNADVLHRIGVIASTALDCLPNSGGMVAVLTISGISYADGYKHLFMTCVVITSIVAILSTFIGIMLYPIG